MGHLQQLRAHIHLDKFGLGQRFDVEQERVRKELELARQIQESLLPSDSPSDMPTTLITSSAITTEGSCDRK